jgi:hypothetical protein
MTFSGRTESLSESPVTTENRRVNAGKNQRESMSENNVSPFCLFDGEPQTQKRASIPRVSGPEVSQRVWTIVLPKSMEAHT